MDRNDAGGGGGGGGGSILNGGGRTSVAGGVIEENGVNISNGAIDEQDVNDPTTADGTEEMTERDIREAAQMNDHLGKQIVRIELFIKDEIKFFLLVNPKGHKTIQ